MGEKIGGPEILATAKRRVLNKKIEKIKKKRKHNYSVPRRAGHPRFHGKSKRQLNTLKLNDEKLSVQIRGS